MKIQVFAIYDSKAGAHSVPFFLATLGLAMRAFAEAVNAVETTIGKNPEDFTLFHLGEWDDENTEFDLLDAPKNLGRASNFKKGDSDVRKVA